MIPYVAYHLPVIRYLIALSSCAEQLKYRTDFHLNVTPSQLFSAIYQFEIAGTRLRLRRAKQNQT
jgi:hypothetical protein